jgi:hypothetical protein
MHYGCMAGGDPAPTVTATATTRLLQIDGPDNVTWTLEGDWHDPGYAVEPHPPTPRDTEPDES